MIDLSITFLASILIWCLFFGLVIVGLIKGKIKKGVIFHAFLVSFIAWGITEIIKNIIPSTRPFIAGNFPIFTLTIPLDNAFPSGHSAAAFALATSLWLENKKIGYLFLLGAMLIGIGRILANVHYPFDITGGSLIGIFAAFILKKFRFSS